MNNRLLNTINTIVDYFLLNVLWVIASIPLITIFPATAAMFGVVRKRQLQKETNGIFKSFYIQFKDNFKQSILLSIVWGIVGAFLYVDYKIISPESSAFQLILYILLIIGLILFSSITIYLFPIMVHFELNWKNVIRNAFFFSLMNPILTILLLIIVGIGGAILYAYPVSIFILGSFLAFIVYYLCQMMFNQVMIKKEIG
ncbi:YesL family protein [Jeotgalibacillus soli]|uniref:Integral membrane protein n=1 Tax=Jeotgalibacillus soli TaxID=889306 RepID=A0A0C2V8A6_9BACL|nr:DUF624 domain-containing protein [Jeotgalibacillus soli]KIL45192.1 hypothetical protein KP78_27360 [Jeotgalibacillus soli]